MRIGISLVCAVVFTAAASAAPNAALDHRVHSATTHHDRIRTPAAAVERVKAECHGMTDARTWRAELHGRSWSAWQLVPSRKGQRCISAGGEVDKRSARVKCFSCIH